jgi:hypothetical protein
MRVSIVLAALALAFLSACDKKVSKAIEEAQQTNGFQASVTGNVHSVGGELGTWDATINDCHSGEVHGFYGADFGVASQPSWTFRYVHDEAAGDVVKVLIPTKDTALVFDRDAKCTVLEGSVTKTNVTKWTNKGNIRLLNGQVKFDCVHSKGAGHITGNATFSMCGP